MNKLKHTPGPWVLTTNPLECQNDDVAGSVYGPYKNGGSPFICDVSKSSGEDTALFNAQLIAAAPDLLEVAIAAYIRLRLPVAYKPDAEAELLGNLIKAIKKATNNHSIPMYKHNSCYAECFYLGQMDQFDLYYQREFDNHTVVARFGDNDYDYHIGLNSPLESLKEAQRRAIDKGFIKKNGCANI